MTWKEEIIEALKNLGGEAHLSEINAYIQMNTERTLPVNWKAAVRERLERNSSDSTSYNGSHDLFYSVAGMGNGLWGLRNYEPDFSTMDLTQDDAGFSEGRANLKLHILRERNHQVIALAKQKALDRYGVLRCEICGFDFEEHYGEIGRNFIEGHHIKPVSQLAPDEKTRVEDIVLLCSNCHSMIHRKKPWLAKEQLQSLLISNNR